MERVPIDILMLSDVADERRREAERARLLNALDPPRHLWRPLAARLGIALSRAGCHLETWGTVRRMPAPIQIGADPCHGCAD